jgi:hypothetical protein
VVVDADDPLAARCPVGAVGQDGRILERDVDLVVETVRNPRADFLRRAFASAHAQVERMMNVIARLLRAQPCFELFGRPGNRMCHSEISMPS